MTFQRPTRRLEPDEAADLAARRGVFSGDELAGFEGYCANLYRLADLHGVQHDAALRSHGCPAHCGRMVPAGLPNGWRDSKFDLCPACIHSRRLGHAVNAELNSLSPGDEATERAAFFRAVAKIGGA